MRVGLIVHGVGSHARGAVLDYAVRALGDAAGGHEWREFNWSDLPGVVDGRTLSLDNIRSMTEGLAAAARLGGARNRMALAAELVFAIALTLPLLSPLLTGLLVLIRQQGFWDAVALQRLGLEWLLAGAAVPAAIYLLAALARAAAGRDLAPVSEWLRWAVLLVVRPIVLVGLLPFAPFLWEFLSWGGEAGKVFTWFTVTGLFAAAFGWLWGEPYAVMGNLAAAAFVVVGLCLTWFAGQLVYFLFGPTLKALLDVFRYLGDPALRATLHAAFDGFIADLPADETGGRRVTVYAHSLGSIIALDSLLHSPAWRASDSIELVTFGSPLRRLVMRFFPGALFPGTIARLDADISARVGDFRWINFFRTLDYVGGALGLARAGAGRDLRSRSWTKSHSGYFGDAEMWQTAAAALSAAGDARYGGSTPGPYETALDAGRTPPSFAHTARLVARSGYVLAPAAAILYVMVAVATGGRLHGEASAALRDALSAKGVTAPAFVTHWRVQIPGDPPEEVDHFRFAIGNQAEREIEVSQGETVFAGYNALFSVGDLRDAVRADCELAFEPALLQRQIRVPCRARRPIDVRYLPGDPARFDIPAFPPHASALRRGFDWFRLLAIGVVWCLVGGAMNTWLAGGWTRLLLGVRA